MKKYWREGLLLLFSILALTFFFTKGNLLNYFLKPYLESIAFQELGLKTSIQQVDFSIFTRALNIYEINLKDSSGTHIYIPQINASLQLKELFLGKIALHKIFIDHPKAAIQFGSLVQKKKRFFSWTSLFGFEFNQITIEDADIDISHPNFKISNPHIFVKASRKNKKYLISLNAHDFRGSHRNTPFHSGPLSLEGLISFNVKNRSLEISDTVVKSSFGKLSIQASLNFTSAYHLNTAAFFLNTVPFYLVSENSIFKLHSKEFNIQKLFPEFQLKGQGSFEGILGAQNKKILLTASSSLKNVSFKNIFLGNSSFSISSDFKKTALEGVFQHPTQKTRGNLTFSLSTEKRISGEGEVHFTDLTAFNENFSSLFILFSMIENTYSFPSIRLKKKKGILEGKGHIDKNNISHLSLVSKDFSLEEFDQIPYAVKGPLSINASFQGKIENPQGKIDILLPNTWIERENLGTSHFNIELKDHIFSFSSHLFDKHIHQKGWFHAKGNYPYLVDSTFQQLNFVPYLKMFHKKFLDIKGSLSGSLNITGELLNPSKIGARLHLPMISFSFENYDYKNASPIILEFKDHSFFIRSFLISGPKTHLRAQGHFNLQGKKNLTIEGPFQFDLLHLFSPFIEKSSGISSISLKIQDENLTGSFILNDGTLKTIWFPNSIEELNTTIKFNKKTIAISELNGFLGTGSIHVKGDIDLSPTWTPKMNLEASLSYCSLRYPSEVSSLISGNLFLKGSEAPYVLSGKLLVHEVFYRENIEWAHVFAESPLVEMRDKPIFQLNIILEAPKNIFIKNNLAQVEAKGSIRLIGNSVSPNLQGNLDLVSGSVFFKGNEFFLTSAHMRFAHPKTISPHLIMSAETKIKDYSIFLNFEGSSDKYQFRLSSNPPLSEADVISLLTLGGLQSEIAERGAFEVTSAELGSYLFGGVQEKLQTTTQKTLGITVNFSPSYSDTKHATVPRLFMRKSIGKKVDATFTSTLDKTSIFTDKEFNLKLNLNKNVSLLGVWEDLSEEEIQENSSLGVDLKVQFEFK